LTPPHSPTSPTLTCRADSHWLYKDSEDVGVVGESQTKHGHYRLNCIFHPLRLELQLHAHPAVPPELLPCLLPCLLLTTNKQTIIGSSLYEIHITRITCILLARLIGLCIYTEHLDENEFKTPITTHFYDLNNKSYLILFPLKALWNRTFIATTQLDTWNELLHSRCNNKL